jgi:acyl carrier protein
VSDIYGRLSEVFLDIFDLDDVTLIPKTTAADIEGWDSLNNIRLMATIESAFDVKFTTAEMTGLKNVGELVKVLELRSRGRVS